MLLTHTHTCMHIEYDPIDWEDEPVIQASVAIAEPGHRQHLSEHILEVIEAINRIEGKCARLVDNGKTNRFYNTVSTIYLFVYKAISWLFYH